MDSWRTHKYNCHLSQSLQWWCHTGTEHRSAWRALELRLSEGGGGRSVCKTEYINTSVLVTENRSCRRELSKLHTKDRTKKRRSMHTYIDAHICHKPTGTRTYICTRTHRQTYEEHICMQACMSSETQLYKQEFKNSQGTVQVQHRGQTGQHEDPHLHTTMSSRR